MSAYQKDTSERTYVNVVSTSNAARTGLSTNVIQAASHFDKQFSHKKEKKLLENTHVNVVSTSSAARTGLSTHT